MRVRQIRWCGVNSKTVRNLAIVASVLFAHFLIWALWLKLCRTDLILVNYEKLLTLTDKERFLLDIIPFVKRKGSTDFFYREILLNCFVLAPFGVAFNEIDKKKRIWLHLLICFLFSLTIEVLQYFTLIGGFAPADLITNVISYFVGLAIYHLIFRWLSARVKGAIYVVVIAGLVATLICAVVRIVEIQDVLIMILG